MIAQVPLPATGEIEKWLIAAAAVMWIVYLGKKLFVRKPPIEAEFVMKAEFALFKHGVETQFEKMQSKIDTSFFAIREKLDEVKGDLLADGSRRSGAIQERLNDLDAQVARVDERTKR